MPQDVFPVELDIPNRDSKLLKRYGDGLRAAKEGKLAELAITFHWLIVRVIH